MMIAIGNHCEKDLDSYLFSNTCQIDTFYWKFQIIEYRFEQIFQRMFKRKAVKKSFVMYFVVLFQYLTKFKNDKKLPMKLKNSIITGKIGIELFFRSKSQFCDLEL